MHQFMHLHHFYGENSNKNLVPLLQNVYISPDDVEAPKITNWSFEIKVWLFHFLYGSVNVECDFIGNIDGVPKTQKLMCSRASASCYLKLATFVSFNYTQWFHIVECDDAVGPFE